jgi:hypothetical protein
VSVASQVETAATKSHEDANTAFNWNASCFKVNASKCLADTPGINSILGGIQTFNNLLENVSSQAVNTSVSNLEAAVAPVMTP